MSGKDAAMAAMVDAFKVSLRGLLMCSRCGVDWLDVKNKACPFKGIPALPHDFGGMESEFYFPPGVEGADLRVVFDEPVFDESTLGERAAEFLSFIVRPREMVPMHQYKLLCGTSAYYCVRCGELMRDNLTMLCNGSAPEHDWKPNPIGMSFACIECGCRVSWGNGKTPPTDVAGGLEAGIVPCSYFPF